MTYEITSTLPRLSTVPRKVPMHRARGNIDRRSRSFQNSRRGRQSASPLATGARANCDYVGTCRARLLQQKQYKRPACGDQRSSPDYANVTIVLSHRRVSATHKAGRGCGCMPPTGCVCVCAAAPPRSCPRSVPLLFGIKRGRPTAHQFALRRIHKIKLLNGSIRAQK